MLKQKRYISSVAIFLLVVLPLSGCGQATNSSPSISTGVGTVTQITVVTTVEATGSIAPLRLASISWKSSGTIADVNVQVGQTVQSNDILMSLDPSTVPDNLFTALQNLAEITSPASIVIAQQVVYQAEKDASSAKSARANMTDWYDAAAYQSKYADLVLAQSRLEKAQEAYDAVSGSSVDDPTRARLYQNLYDAQQAVDSAQYYVNLYSAKPTQRQIEEADAKLALAEAKLEEAKNYLAALSGGEVPENATGASLLQLKQARRTVDQLNLRAPFNGIIGALYNQPSDVVTTNSTGAVVIDRSKLFVAVQVEESKVVQLALGDTTTVTLEALPDLNLTGHVIAIDPVGAANQGVVYYSVRVELDQSDPQIPLDATADVTIRAGDAKQELAVPVAAVQSDSTGEYVTVVASDGSNQRVDVVSGQIQADDTVVVQGKLQIGDQVMMMQSSSTTTNGPRGGGGFFGP